MKSYIVLILCGIILYSGIYAQSTPAQAEAFVKKAIQFYKEKGKDVSIAEFNNPAGKFISKDLYIFVLDLTGLTIAHGGNPKLVGQRSMLEVQDPDGKFFMKEFIQLGKTKGKGFVDYKWTNPASKKIEPKTTYIEKADDYIFGCGVYKK